MVSFRSFFLAVALLGSGSYAHPSHSVQSSPNPNSGPLSKRALPQWQNFQTNDPKIAQLTQAYKDMTTIVNTVLNTNVDTFTTVFNNYFTAEVHDTVVNVFRAMVQPNTVDATTGADVLAHIPVLGNNFQPNGGCANTPAYTRVGINGQPSQMHYCDEDGMNAYAYKSLSEISCSDLKNDVDVSMMTLGGSILIHELTHASEVSLGPLGGQGLPAPGVTDDVAYGPMNVRLLKAGLGEFATVNPPPRAVGNADSYSWFATELYWTVKCKSGGQYFDPPTDNNYTPAGVCQTTDAFWCAFLPPPT